MDAAAYIPYCGAPPVPGQVAWNTDPVLAACLIAAGCLYAVGSRHRTTPLWQQVCFWSGFLILSLALVSPLCNLSVALFSARVAQHVILTLVAAPLLIIGRVEQILAGWRWPLFARFAIAMPPQIGWPWSAALLFAVVMWLWHIPAPYDATFHSTVAYWAMHVSMVGAALLLWSSVFRSLSSLAGCLLTIFATMLQMSMLGAIFTFAQSPLFGVHANTTWPWGLSPVQDQQLGGLIMWACGGVALAICGAVALGTHLLQRDAADRFSHHRRSFKGTV